MRKPKDVESYIAAAPREMRGRLQELRSLITKAAPGAEERISYGMPYYDYGGRLAYFALQKKHIGLYIPPPIIEAHQRELKAFETTLSTVRLPLDKRLPAALIRKLVRARMKYNETKKRGPRKGSRA
jgi:uncharacterized protein YdhG (YjbR/CyaY superfamily)